MPRTAKIFQPAVGYHLMDRGLMVLAAGGMRGRADDLVMTSFGEDGMLMLQR